MKKFIIGQVRKVSKADRGLGGGGGSQQKFTIGNSVHFVLRPRFLCFFGWPLNRKKRSN